MVDKRKILPDGSPNPMHNKYARFEPCASVIEAIHQEFDWLDGNITQTVIDLFENGPYLPDFSDPNFGKMVPTGFIARKPSRMLKRGTFYVPSREAVINILTNPVYIGH